MRIISGILGGRVFIAPKSLPVRPTTSLAKESLFNIIDNNYNFDGLKILDVCSGIGSMSLEFYSRGVEKVISIDNNSDCVKYQQKLIRELNISNITILRQEAIQFLKSTKQEFDIIFCDPPYESEIFEKIPELVFEKKLLSNIGWLIIEHPKRITYKKHPNFYKQKKYGKVNFSIFSVDEE